MAMNSEDRRYAENIAICMSRTIGKAAILCSIAFALFGVFNFVQLIIYVVQLASSGSTAVMQVDHTDIEGIHALAYLAILSVASFGIAFVLLCAYRFCRNI